MERNTARIYNQHLALGCNSVAAWKQQTGVVFPSAPLRRYCYLQQGYQSCSQNFQATISQITSWCVLADSWCSTPLSTAHILKQHLQSRLAHVTTTPTAAMQQQTA